LIRNFEMTKPFGRPRRDWEDNIKIYVKEGIARMGERRNEYRILVAKPEGKRPLGRPRRRWVDNIKIDVRGIGWDGME
jgi:hypothetical protein